MGRVTRNTVALGNDRQGMEHKEGDLVDVAHRLDHLLRLVDRPPVDDAAGVVIDDLFLDWTDLSD